MKLLFVNSKLKEWNKVSFRDLREKKKNNLSSIVNIDTIEQEGNLTPKLLATRGLKEGVLE